MNELLTQLHDSPNSLAYPLIIFGAVAAGLKVTCANAAYQAGELAHQYKDSGASHIFAHPSVIPIVTEMFSKIGVNAKSAQNLTWQLTLDEPKGAPGVKALDELLQGGKLSSHEKFNGKDSRETVYMCYSSGTTGLSKGVEVCG